MQDDNRETKTTIKEIVLSEYQREDIFFMRQLTFIVSTIIALFIWILFFGLNGYVATTIFVLNFFVPPLYYFRKGIGGYVKEKINYWWSMINGRIPAW